MIKPILHVTKTSDYNVTPSKIPDEWEAWNEAQRLEWLRTVYQVNPGFFETTNGLKKPVFKFSLGYRDTDEPEEREEMEMYGETYTTREWKEDIEEAI